MLRYDLGRGGYDMGGIGVLCYDIGECYVMLCYDLGGKEVVTIINK